MIERGTYLALAAVLAVVGGVAVLVAPAPIAAAVVVLLILATASVGVIPARAAATPDLEGAREVAADLSDLIAPLREGVLLIGADLRVVAANEAAGRIVGRALESMLDVSLIQSLRDHDVAEIARAASGVAIPVRVSATGHDVVATATVVDAGAVRTLLVLEDVTELERARRARADLVSSLSHELRTPVAAARALAETLQIGVDDDGIRQRFHDRLGEEIGRLESMVERLLRLSRLESGAEMFQVLPFDAGEALEAAARRLEPIAEQRRVSIQVTSAPRLSALGDPERVQELLTNLLDNALRYSPEGGAVYLSTFPDGETVRFEVSDEGPGILPSDRERVFERFYTGDRARAARGGAGLGLSIARHIVQRLGGRIWVEDRSPGATLCFALPRAAGDGVTEGAAASAPEQP